MPTPHPPALDSAIIIDAATNGRTLTDLCASAVQYRAEGYDVFLAPHLMTGTMCLWRRLA